MENGIYNFYAGPAVLPKEVLAEARDELLNFGGTGMSVLEISHRAKPFEALVEEAEANIKELLSLGEEHRVLFLQGGASLQFSMLPLNFLREGETADYVLTGSWSEKALQEARKIGATHVAASGADGKYREIPSSFQWSDAPAYVHLTSNNTIFGTQWREFPDIGAIPLCADMSSDIMCRPIPARRFSLIYAGAQKNLGPAGVTIVIAKKEFLAKAAPVPYAMLAYATHAEAASLYNTPPSFSIYLVNLVTRWLKREGGLAAIEQRNIAKAKWIYDAIDGSGGFYRGHAASNSRSLMNITFTIQNAALEKTFNSQAEKEGLIGLKGHRSVGGLRASTYNALPPAAAEALAGFMAEFQKKNG